MRGELNSLDKLLITKLAATDNIYIYDANDLLSFNAIDLITSIQKLANFEFITYKDGTISRSKTFKIRYIKSRYLVHQRNNDWRKDLLTGEKLND